MAFHRLLVPLDGSRLAESVLPAVQRIAIACGAEVTLMHIREARPPASIHGERHLADPNEAGVYLESVAELLRRTGVLVSWHVHESREGDVAASILQHADEFQPDLVVLCTHGHGGVRDVLFGSIAQQVLQRGRWPVLVVEPQADGSAPAFDPQRIVMPVEGSERHPAPLELGARLACALGSELHLVMVVPTRETLIGDRSAPRRTMPATVTAILELAEENASKYLQDAMAECNRTGAKVIASVLRGHPVEQIVQYAESVGAELIIIASHGKVGLEALVSGSFGARIVARVGTPLLLVRT